MSSDSREERERLKEEYKEHYRKIREVKERLARSQKTKNISDALKNMDTSRLTDSFDEFLYKVKNKIANVEARLDVAMDSLATTDEDLIAEAECDEELKKARAKETLRQAKIEMGLLYNEIEQQADAMSVEKTIGAKKPSGSQNDESSAKKDEQSEEQE